MQNRTRSPFFYSLSTVAFWSLCPVQMGCAQAPQTQPQAPTTLAPIDGPHSALWGKAGERWTATSRLPDFSYAGYRSGEAPIPQPAVTANVRDFGAKGDGETDDTQSFVRALEAVQNGALFVPNGRYKITEILYIRKSNIVLRGESRDKTIIVFPKPLEHIKPNSSATTTGQATSGYSWSGGLIWVEGKQSGAEIGQVKAKALRGSHTIELAAPATVAAGQRVEVFQEATEDRSLVTHLYGGQPDDVSKISRTRTGFVSRVDVVNGTQLKLESPLRTDVDPKWKARVRVFQPSVTEVGVENFTFEFPNGTYSGHFTESGFNPLAFSGVADCWARNLRVVNADSGPFLSGRFITVENIIYEANRPVDEAGNSGHHGFTMGNDNLLRDFDFRTKFVHDISVEGSAGSVVAQGRGVDLCFDNHKRHPHANLFTDIDLGAGTRMYRSGGGAGLGRHAGAWTTFWNIRAQRPQRWPANNFGPDLMNLVGLESKDAPVLQENGRWFEPIAPAQLQPRNLYAAQLAKRLSGDKRLSWAPPLLENPTTVEISPTNRSPRLDPKKDYLIKMPATPLTVKGGLTLSGGRNVVLIGGSIIMPPAAEAAGALDRRAVYLKGQTGTIHIEGLHIGGAELAEAFNLDQRLGAIVQLQNIRIETVRGLRAGHHADLVQTWAGPAELRIDGLTGSTDYQGFFLLPNQHFTGDAPRKFDFRRMNITGTDKAGYLLWRQTNPAFEFSLSEVWLQPNPKRTERDQFLWPKPSTGDKSWENVKIGVPPTGDFVPEGVAGLNYVSPGYIEK